MPTSPSAYKRMRSDAKKFSRNNTALSELKTLRKSLRTAVTQKTAKDLDPAIKPVDPVAVAKDLIKNADSAARRGIIPKARANRIKSRANAALFKLSRTPAK